ncbi:MAG TPA: MauE/DoxX family redox-associated membrane protein [Solirubrobacteraceae bacterium]
MIVEVVRMVLAVVFLLAAVSKLADRRASREAVVAFGVPEHAAGALSAGLIGGELTIAAALLLDASKTVGAVAALALLAIVSAAAATNLLRGRDPECRCFGRLSRSSIGWATLARNALLISIAGYVAAGGRAPTLFWGLAAVSGAVWLALGPLRPRRRRGARAPGFQLSDPTGAHRTLDSLLGGNRHVLLVFSQPGCGACHAIRADLQHWHRRLGERLTVAVVEHAREAEPADYPVLLDQAGDVAAAYGIDATPSAVLIGANGRLASGVARGAGEIEELVEPRFAQDEAPRFERRALILRAARGASTLGAFPLLVAACGSSSSSSSTGASSSTTSTTTTTATQPTSLKVGSAYICKQKYALCTNAPCRPDPHHPKLVICDCVVEDGYSVGLTPCEQKAPHGDVLYSTFSTELVKGDVKAMTCAAGIPWANCVDYPCKLDPNDPTKATCACGLVKTGPSFTFGGNCNTGTCGKTVWSGAHTTLGGPQVAAAFKRVGQPLANPQPCPKA